MSRTLNILEHLLDKKLERNVEVGLLGEGNVVGDQVNGCRRPHNGYVIVRKILVVGVRIHCSKAVKVLDAVHEGAAMNVVEVFIVEFLVGSNKFNHSTSTFLVVHGVQRVIKLEELSKVVAEYLDRHSKAKYMCY